MPEDIYSESDCKIQASLLRRFSSQQEEYELLGEVMDRARRTFEAIAIAFTVVLRQLTTYSITKEERSNIKLCICCIKQTLNTHIIHSVALILHRR